MTEGISLADYRRRFGFDLEERFLAQLGEAQDSGLVEIADGSLRLTRRGMLFSNEVFSSFV
jgi:oxygen-independent coproporphyrinogen III oxidase